jgi:hypothetical protein
LFELSVLMSKPLREGINEFVIDYVQAKTATGEAIDAAEIAYEMAQSLIDIIMTEGAEGQASLFALVLAGLGEEYLLRSGVLDAGHEIAN